MVIPWVGFSLSAAARRRRAARRREVRRVPDAARSGADAGPAQLDRRCGGRTSKACASTRRCTRSPSSPPVSTARSCRRRTARRCGWSCRGSTASRASSRSSGSRWSATSRRDDVEHRRPRRVRLLRQRQPEARPPALEPGHRAAHRRDRATRHAPVQRLRRPGGAASTPGWTSMSTSERLVDTRLLKQLTLVGALVPAALLAWDAWHGQLGVNAVNFVIRTTGLVGLVLITLSLLVTPLRELTGWSRVIAMRRGLGVVGFAYLAVHFLVFFLLDRQASVASTLHEIVDPALPVVRNRRTGAAGPAGGDVDGRDGRAARRDARGSACTASPIRSPSARWSTTTCWSSRTSRSRWRSPPRLGSCCCIAWSRTICGSERRRRRRTRVPSCPRRQRHRAHGPASW